MQRRIAQVGVMEIRVREADPAQILPSEACWSGHGFLLRTNQGKAALGCRDNFYWGTLVPDIVVPATARNVLTDSTGVSTTQSETRAIRGGSVCTGSGPSCAFDEINAAISPESASVFAALLIVYVLTLVWVSSRIGMFFHAHAPCRRRGGKAPPHQVRGGAGAISRCCWWPLVYWLRLRFRSARLARLPELTETSSTVSTAWSFTLTSSRRTLPPTRSVRCTASFSTTTSPVT